MVFVEGESCPDAEQTCLDWLDPPPYQNLRCGVYSTRAVCKSPRRTLRFCIDREEFAESSSAGSAPLPLVKQSWKEAQGLCQRRGARLCKESEWELACEAPRCAPTLTASPVIRPRAISTGPTLAVSTKSLHLPAFVLFWHVAFEQRDVCLISQGLASVARRIGSRATLHLQQIVASDDMNR